MEEKEVQEEKEEVKQEEEEGRVRKRGKKMRSDPNQDLSLASSFQPYPAPPAPATRA